MSTLKDCLMSNEEYYNIRFMAEDIITSKTTLSSFLYFADLIIPESLENLTSFVDYISLSFLQELIKYKRYHNIQLKATVLRAYQKNRLYIAYTIISEFPFIQIELLENMPNEILRQKTIENFIKAQSKIGNILKKNETNIHSLKEILAQTFDIGMLTIQENKSLLDLAGMDNKYLWILNALPNQSISQFCFDKCFSFKYQCLSSFSTVFAIFKKRFGKQASSLFLNSFRKIDFARLDDAGYGDIFVTNLIEVMIENNTNKNNYIKSIDDEKQTIFHILARFRNITNGSLDKIIENIKLASLSWDELLDSKTRKGETILMIYASKSNFEAINKLKDIGFDIKTRDIYGNNILHKILEDDHIFNRRIAKGFFSNYLKI